MVENLNYLNNGFKSLLAGMKYMFKNKNLQIFGLIFNTNLSNFHLLTATHNFKWGLGGGIRYLSG